MSGRERCDSRAELGQDLVKSPLSHLRVGNKGLQSEFPFRDLDARCDQLRAHACPWPAAAVLRLPPVAGVPRQQKQPPPRQPPLVTSEHGDHVRECCGPVLCSVVGDQQQRPACGSRPVTQVAYGGDLTWSPQQRCSPPPRPGELGAQLPRQPGLALSTRPGHQPRRPLRRSITPGMQVAPLSIPAEEIHQFGVGPQQRRQRRVGRQRRPRRGGASVRNVSQQRGGDLRQPPGNILNPGRDQASAQSSVRMRADRYRPDDRNRRLLGSGSAADVARPQHRPPGEPVRVDGIHRSEALPNHLQPCDLTKRQVEINDPGRESVTISTRYVSREAHHTHPLVHRHIHAERDDRLSQQILSLTLRQASRGQRRSIHHQYGDIERLVLAKHTYRYVLVAVPSPGARGAQPKPQPVPVLRYVSHAMPRGEDMLWTDRKPGTQHLARDGRCALIRHTRSALRPQENAPHLRTSH